MIVMRSTAVFLTHVCGKTKIEVWVFNALIIGDLFLQLSTYFKPTLSSQRLEQGNRAGNMM